MLFMGFSILSMILVGHANPLSIEATTFAATALSEASPVATPNGEPNATSSHHASEGPGKSAVGGFYLECYSIWYSHYCASYPYYYHCTAKGAMIYSNFHARCDCCTCRAPSDNAGEGIVGGAGAASASALGEACLV
jgi:hypothetical protein